MRYKVSYWYAGQQLKTMESGITYEEAVLLKQKLSVNREMFVHHEIHEDTGGE